MSQLFLIAFRNLVQHSRRTLLLGGAIAGVTALLVFLICLSSGVRSTMLRSATTVSTGHINVAGFYKVSAGQSAPVVMQYEKVLGIVKGSLTDIDYIAARGRGWARVISDSNSMQLAIGGVDIDEEPGIHKVLKLTQGSLEELHKPDTVLIFAQQAKKLEVKVGDTLVLSVLTPRGVNNTIDVRVVAIAEDIGLLSAWSIFVPNPTVRSLYQYNADSIGAIHVYVKDLKKIPEDIDKLRTALTAAGFQTMDRESKAFWMKTESVNREDWTGQKIDLTSWDDEVSFFKWTTASVDGLTFMLTLVLLVIIAIGIMNSMWIAIRERTREIGTLRAIGMQRRRVLAMFLIEAFSLGAIGTVLGAGLGLVLAMSLNMAHIPVPEMAQMFLMSNTLKFSFELSRVLGGMFIITFCTTLISVFPAMHAARLKPVTAMSHIG